MNNALKATLLATSLFASVPVFAATTPSAQVNTNAEVKAEKPGVITRVNQGVQNTADKVGNGIEKGVDNTKEFTQDKWQATKEKSHELKEKAEDNTDKLKQNTKQKWQNTKEALKSEPKNSGMNGNAELRATTPAGNAEAGVNAEGHAVRP